MFVVSSFALYRATYVSPGSIVAAVSPCAMRLGCLILALGGQERLFSFSVGSLAVTGSVVSVGASVIDVSVTIVEELSASGGAVLSF